jgi:hypothetical protein
MPLPQKWRRHEREEIHNPSQSTRLDKRRLTMHRPNELELATMRLATGVALHYAD